MYSNGLLDQSVKLKDFFTERSKIKMKYVKS